MKSATTTKPPTVRTSIRAEIRRLKLMPAGPERDAASRALGERITREKNHARRMVEFHEQAILSIDRFCEQVQGPLTRGRCREHAIRQTSETAAAALPERSEQIGVGNPSRPSRDAITDLLWRLTAAHLLFSAAARVRVSRANGRAAGAASSSTTPTLAPGPR